MNTVVVRNNVSKTLSPQVYGKLSPNKGATFYAPEINSPDLSQFTPEEQTKINSIFADFVWVGFDEIAKLATNKLRSVFSAINLDPEFKNADGTINEENLMSAWQDFTAGRTTLDDLDTEIEALQDLSQSYWDAMNELGLDDAGSPITEKGMELMKLIRINSPKIKALKAKKAAVNAKYEAVAAARKAKKEASEAATK